MTDKYSQFSFSGAGNITDRDFNLVLAEFAANGARYLVLKDVMLNAILEDPVRFILLKEKMHQFGLSFRDAHGLWGSIHDLNSDDRQFRPKMIDRQKLAMGYAKDAGCLTYTVHIGAQCCYGPFPCNMSELRKLAADSLSQLIPEAEKLDIMLCVENNYEPTNTPDEVLALIRQFSSPKLGVCFDSGHANILTSKSTGPSCYGEDILMPWKNQIVFEDHALEKLAPYIVTCHLHDNNGCSDAHRLPGDGSFDWKKNLPVLAKCPRLQTMQTECSLSAHNIAVRTLCETFYKLADML